jgi:hypothetical protein
MEPGCMAGPRKNNLPIPSDLTKNHYVYLKIFFLRLQIENRSRWFYLSVVGKCSINR